MSGKSAGLTAWQLLFEYSPIILVGGVTDLFPGFMVPIIALTEAVNFPLGLLGGGAGPSLDRMFAKYQVLHGTTLLSQESAKYPYANSTVAANATIKQPTEVSVLMICPVQEHFGYYAKLAIMEALTSIFDRHNLAGGTYTIATPSQIFTNCVFRTLVDVSSGDTKQLQHAWQLVFEKPLLTLSDAERVMNGFANQLERQVQITANPAYSGLGSAVATSGGAVAPGVIPAAVPASSVAFPSSPLIYGGGGTTAL
jgi:hypothetical protein